MTPADASTQCRFLARCAREYGALWPKQSSRSYPGEHLVRTAYSAYRVVDGRCIVVQRAGRPEEEDEHECLGTHLVGYLVRHENPLGARWTLHRSPRPEAKAVFWRPTPDGHGHFVVTSRLASGVGVSTPTGTVAAVARSAPPPLPSRAGARARA